MNRMTSSGEALSSDLSQRCHTVFVIGGRGGGGLGGS